MNQSPNSDVNWNVNYNTQNKYVDLEITKHNKTQHLTFDKDDISNLLNTRSVNKPIHERLMEDSSSLHHNSSPLHHYNVGDEVSTIKKLENELETLYKNKLALATPLPLIDVTPALAMKNSVFAIQPSKKRKPRKSQTKKRRRNRKKHECR